MRHFIATIAILLLVSSSFAQDGKQLVVQQWVTMSPEGRIDVAIVAQGLQPESLAEGALRVALVSQDGVIYDAEPSPNSPVELSFAGVPAGAYTLVTRGPNLVASYAIHVLDRGEDKVDPMHHQLVVAAAPMRINKVRGAIVRYMPTAVPFVAEFEPADGSSAMNALSPMQTMRVAQVGGGLKGKIYRAGMESGKFAGAGLVNILVYRDRELMAQSVSKDDGTFEIETLAPGKYGLIAVGPDGFAVTGFTLVDELITQKESASVGRLVAFQAPSMQPSLELQLAPAGSESPAVDELLADDESDDEDEESPEDEEPFDYDALTGGETTTTGGGGGGGGGGGVGGGGLLAAGVAAAAIAGGDNGNSFSTPPATSPITP